MKPIIAIVGRANVGKSTLFNRLVGAPSAIVEDLPGTTRDRIFGDALLEGREVTLVDTGGLELKPGSKLAEKVKDQVEVAIQEADVIIFLTDVRDGLVPADLEIAERLRHSLKPVVLVVNKVDTPKVEPNLAEFHRLGLGVPNGISAYHKRGIDDLTDALLASLPEAAPAAAEPDRLKLAIVGRPNVGKSTLVNAILGKERAIVDEAPGTTRDAIDTVFRYDDREVLLIDTAGIRRRGRVDRGIEYYGVIRALRAIDRSDVVLLVLDATEAMTAQDLHIAGYVKDALRGMIVVANKNDLLPQEKRDEFEQIVRKRLDFMPYVPIFLISAKLAEGLSDLLPQAQAVKKERNIELSEDTVNDFVKEAVKVQIPPKSGTKLLKFYGGYQSRTNPPGFVFIVNDPKIVHFSYKRFLENRLRRAFGFYGTPIGIGFRKLERRGKREVSNDRN